jgi:CDP-2,3-bis-(O-geranylgeranyl)-sn-glycerol synthase
MNEWWEALWFFLPAGVANIVPPLAAMMPLLARLDTPLDFGHSWRGNRITGDHKTWRGLICGIAAAVIVGLFQYRFIAYSAETTGFIIAATAAMGCGALVGDAIKSFFKRRHGVKPGHSWFPFDQTDYIIGGLLFVYPFIQLSLVQATQVLVIYFVLHIVVGYISYLFGLKDSAI